MDVDVDAITLWNDRLIDHPGEALVLLLCGNDNHLLSSI